MLHMIKHGAPTEKPGLLAVHGLFGSARNLGGVARKLADTRQVICVDQRNHGSSDWKDSHSYHDMAGDLAEVLDSLEGPFDVLGHSMGGKAAMVLALEYPEKVNNLIVADIAPVPYDHTQIQYIHAMRQVDLSAIRKRSDAKAMLEQEIHDPGLVAFFLQSIDLGQKRWVLNLDVLEREMDKILSFPDISKSYHGRTLFLSGAESDYVERAHRPRIKALFPKARFAKIPGAGHFLHAEQPRRFEAAVRAWLG